MKRTYIVILVLLTRPMEPELIGNSKQATFTIVMPKRTGPKTSATRPFALCWWNLRTDLTAQTSGTAWQEKPGNELMHTVQIEWFGQIA